MKKSEAKKLRTAIVQVSESLPVEMAIEVPELFQKWTVGESVTVETIRCYNNVLYKVIQAHTTQSDWTPDIVPALWNLHRPEDVIAEWIQPPAENPYMKGDKVLFGGNTYESLIDNNVWSPAGYPAGWIEI